MSIYYVYAYLRSKDSSTAKAGTPYYIGKGKGDRAYKKHHFNIPKDKSKIIFLETNLTEVGALAIERRLISWWGRKDLNTGILRNKTDGGDMPPNNKGTKRSLKSRNLISQSLKGNSRSKGIVRSQEYKNNLSRYWKQYNLDNKNILICDPLGNIIFRCSNDFDKICRENGLPYIPLSGSILKFGRPLYINGERTISRYKKFKGWFAVKV